MARAQVRRRVVIVPRARRRYKARSIVIERIECLLADMHAEKSIHLRQNQLTALWEDQLIRLDFLQSDVLESFAEP